ncbi:MAG: hypothetical protein J0H68_08040 [Sphingobacteriia bacterium]|nr:hypothetical protein [Sphingobacteriia bacterium]
MRLPFIIVAFLTFLLSGCMYSVATKNCNVKLGTYHYQNKTLQFNSCVESEVHRMKSDREKYFRDLEYCRKQAESVHPIPQTEKVECFDANYNHINTYYSIKEFVKLGNNEICPIKQYAVVHVSHKQDRDFDKRKNYMNHCISERGWDSIPEYVNYF